ncbi:MAG: hypothetical protein QM680_11155 [Luteolibacter sp.]
MNFLHPRPPAPQRYSCPCPNCGVENFLPVITLITSEEELSAFFEQKQNRTTCVSCGAFIEAQLTVQVSLSMPPYSDHQFIPPEWLQDPQVLDKMREEGFGVHYSYSLHDLECSILAKLALFERRKELRRQLVSLRQITIPEEIHQRIAGTYKKSKLKVIWFVSTHFEEGKCYERDECWSVIGYALSRLEQHPAHGQGDHIFSALRQLRFLDPTEDGKYYRKSAI